MAEQFISVKQASEQSDYSQSHIRNLLSKGVLDGQKFANVWMVNARSLEAHKAAMAQLGAKKHGAWAATSTTVEAAR
jgi:hypothetical protein